MQAGVKQPRRICARLPEEVWNLCTGHGVVDGVARNRATEGTMGGSLMRSRLDRRIAGVCGGLAQHLGWDSTLIRVLWVCFVLFAGTGVLAYIVLWIVLPEEPYGLPPYTGYAPPPQGYPGTPQGYGNQPGTYAPPQAYPGAQQPYPGSGEAPNGSTQRS